MPYVRFTADFDWSPRQGVEIAYKQGYHGLVTTACAKAAKTARRAVASTKNGGERDARRAVAGAAGV